MIPILDLRKGVSRLEYKLRILCNEDVYTLGTYANSKYELLNLYYFDDWSAYKNCVELVKQFIEPFECLEAMV